MDSLLSTCIYEQLAQDLTGEREDESRGVTGF